MGERLGVRDEMIVENGSIDAVRITAIELSDGVRATEAGAETIRAVWAQKIDKVVVKIAVHTGNITRSYKVPFDGEKELSLGTKNSTERLRGLRSAGPRLAARAKWQRQTTSESLVTGPARRNERSRSTQRGPRKSAIRR